LLSFQFFNSIDVHPTLRIATMNAVGRIVEKAQIGLDPKQI
jgi:hypothetical protein